MPETVLDPHEDALIIERDGSLRLELSIERGEDDALPRMTMFLVAVASRAAADDEFVDQMIAWFVGRNPGRGAE